MFDFCGQYAVEFCLKSINLLQSMSLRISSNLCLVLSSCKLGYMQLLATDPHFKKRSHSNLKPVAYFK